jgi:hypothetical protein
MGFLFIFLSFMFLSADLPLGFLAGSLSGERVFTAEEHGPEFFLSVSICVHLWLNRFLLSAFLNEAFL